jgi:putative transposase
MVEMSGCELSIVQQCILLSLCRSTLYYKPEGQETDLNLKLMEELDKQYLKTPFYGFRKMTMHLKNLGYAVNRKRVRRLMRLMGLETIYRKPNTSLPNKEHHIYPYLLSGTKITHINQVWATDITYIPMKKGFMYLMAIMDLYSRKVLHWSVSNTMEAEWCTQVLKTTIQIHGKPHIFNTDQGSQFTSSIFTQVLKDHDVQISMDGKGRAIDNIFVERLWRSVKYENIYLKAYENGLDLQKGLNEYFYFYNQQRFHESLSYQTPNQIYAMAA